MVHLQSLKYFLSIFSKEDNMHIELISIYYTVWCIKIYITVFNKFINKTPSTRIFIKIIPIFRTLEGMREL